MLVAGGADTQLGSSCVLAPLATNVDLWKPITLLRQTAALLLGTDKNSLLLGSTNCSSVAWLRMVS